MVELYERMSNSFALKLIRSQDRSTRNTFDDASQFPSQVVSYRIMLGLYDCDTYAHMLQIETSLTVLHADIHALTSLRTITLFVSISHCQKGTGM
jgi:hypothetical protein